MFAERLPALPSWLSDFTPAWAYSDRCRWKSLSTAYTQRLLATASEHDRAWPVITASDYLRFNRSGDRVTYETPYMQRRRMLNSFALAECVVGSGAYMDRIIDGAMLLCEESGWQLPAHNSYIRDTPTLPLPDPDQPVIDLFAAETGAQLAVLAWLFESEMNAVSPLIVQRIDNEIHHRILEPYLSEHFWWMGNGNEPMNNWTAWCTQNILITAFTRPIDQQTRHAIIARASNSLDAFLKDYGEDGACEEGVLYYRHAGLCLFNALNILATVAPDAFAPLWRNPKVRNIAEFVTHMHIANDRYFNFADSSARAGYCGAREFLFGKAVGSDLLMDFAAASAKQDPAPDLPDEINLFYRLQAAMTASALAEHHRPAKKPKDIFFPSIGLMIARDDHFALAAKAGNNGESHNHNDTGSFTLYKDGKPFVIDVGVESYTAKTFSARRYEIWTMQSAFHNLPTFGGVMQQDGEAFAARDVRVETGESTTSISMELAGAYPPESRIESYRRTVTFTKKQAIEIEDKFSGDRPTELSLMFAAKPILTTDRITVEGVGYIDIDGAGDLRCECIPLTDSRLRAAWPEAIYRVLIPLSCNTLRLKIH